MALLSKVISRETGYSEAECKKKLLKKMDRENRQYQADLNAKAIEPDSWAAITICYGSSDPQVFIKAVGKKDKEKK